jgi:hypothetical protein
LIFFLFVDCLIATSFTRFMKAIVFLICRRNYFFMPFKFRPFILPLLKQDKFLSQGVVVTCAIFWMSQLGSSRLANKFCQQKKNSNFTVLYYNSKRQMIRGKWND